MITITRRIGMAISHLCLVGVLGAACAANATPVTFDFTGTVFQSYGSYSGYTLGSTVTGTYTFDLSAADPSQSSSSGVTPGTSWYADAHGGTFYGFAALPSGLLFTSTLAGSPGYVTQPIGGTGVDSYVLGNNGTYQAGETHHAYTNSNIALTSGIYLLGTAPIETADGLPQFALANLKAIGSIYDEEYLLTSHPDYVGYLQYNITSLTAETTTSVPEPTTLSLLGLGFAAMGFMQKRKLN